MTQVQRKMHLALWLLLGPALLGLVLLSLMHRPTHPTAPAPFHGGILP